MIDSTAASLWRVVSCGKWSRDSVWNAVAAVRPKPKITNAVISGVVIFPGFSTFFLAGIIKIKGLYPFWWSFASQSHQGDRIRTYGPLYPKQMRWPDCATPRLTTPEHIDPPDRWTLKPNSPILLGTGTREPIWVINRFLSASSKIGRRQKKAYSAGALTFFGLLFNFHFQIRLAPGLWTLRPLRSGFEPLTQGFSVLCSNQLSYLNHLPKVCFLPGYFQSFALTS